VFFFTRILGHLYQNSGTLKFHILDECIYLFTRILGHPYQNSGILKFHILECISFFTRILGHSYQNSGTLKFHILHSVHIFFHQNFRASVPKFRHFEISHTRVHIFFTRILGHPYQNSCTLKFQILECISFFTEPSPAERLTTVSCPLYVVDL
jgi:hypothetical protein